MYGIAIIWYRYYLILFLFVIVIICYYLYGIVIIRYCFSYWHYLILLLFVRSIIIICTILLLFLRYCYYMYGIVCYLTILEARIPLCNSEFEDQLMAPFKPLVHHNNMIPRGLKVSYVYISQCVPHFAERHESLGWLTCWITNCLVWSNWKLRHSCSAVGSARAEIYFHFLLEFTYAMIVFGIFLSIWSTQHHPVISCSKTNKNCEVAEHKKPHKTYLNANQFWLILKRPHAMILATKVFFCVKLHRASGKCVTYLCIYFAYLYIYTLKSGHTIYC